MSDLVSIVVANYNKEQYIYEAIESIILQDYENIEIIIIDDGSTDKSNQIINELAKQDSRIIYKRIKHKGKIMAYNYGVSIAKGKYIKIASSDDVLFKNAISTLAREIGKNQVICHNTKITDDELNVIEDGINMSKYKNVRINKILNGLSFPSGCYMFERTIIESLYPIPDSATFEDWYIFLFLITNNVKIRFINKRLSYYRQVKDSAYGGFYNVDKNIFIYRARRELYMLSLFIDMLPGSYENIIKDIERELKLIEEGRFLKALIHSKFDINRRSFKIIVKRLYYPILKIMKNIKGIIRGISIIPCRSV